jgi:hypothetical protein
MTDLIKGEHGGALPLVPVEPVEIIPPFDYTKLDADFAAELQRTANRVRERNREEIEIGRDLLAVKDRLEHGDFTAWVEDECGLKVRTAQRFMQAALLIAKNDKLSYLPVDGLTALSSPRAPKATVDGIIARIEAGARPSAAAITREIAAAKRKVTRTPAVAAPALEPGGKPTEEAAGSSVEQELAVLNDAWERASPEARQLFLVQKETVLTTPPLAEAADPSATPTTVQPPPPEPSEESAALPPRPQDGGNSIPPTENDVHRPVLSSSTAASNDDDAPRKSAVGEPLAADPGLTGLGGDRQSVAGQIEETQPVTVATASASPEAVGDDAAAADEVKEAAPVPERIAPVAPGQLASLRPHLVGGGLQVCWQACHEHDPRTDRHAGANARA